LQNPSQVNGGNLKNLRCETSRIFRNKKREHLKGKINELGTNNKNKNIRDLYRGINEFKKEYQPGINIIKERPLGRHRCRWEDNIKLDLWAFVNTVMNLQVL
jgi:hypothetical protein